NYTGDRRALLSRLERIEPTEATTSLREALQVAAGLANPSKQIGEGVVASSVITPKLLIYTDGGFPDVEGFSLGNLEPEVLVIGPPPPPLPQVVPGEDATPEASPARSSGPSDNVAILALQTRRDEEKVDLYQIFGRVHNFRDEPVETEARLLRREADRPNAEGALLDAIALSIPARSEQSFKFDLPASGLTELEVRIDVADAQPLDNKAFALIGDPRKAQVLLVTEGNRYLVDTFRTPAATERADVVVITPEQAKGDPFARDARAGRYDLVIYDRFRPEVSPEANTLYFGEFPPGPAYEAARDVERPVILDWNVSHPLMQYIRDLPKVVILKAKTVEPPPGSTVLIESNLGPIAFIAPREGYSDAVVTFPLLEGDAFNTTWFREISFPLFLFNSLQFLGNAREGLGDQVALPGQPVTLRAEAEDGTIRLTGPEGTDLGTVSRSAQGAYVVTKADRTGLYHARWNPNGLLPFAVNQFDTREADLAPRGLVPDGVPAEKADAYKIKIGYNPVTGTRVAQPSRQDWWKPLAFAALAVLLIEWYIYNKRVYI
ncbi:MAG: RNA polymerase II transcription initiation/nucleotide excision repair factor TFIIH, subunit SSL1, partial [Isosphaeraceae bacterium]